MLGASLWYVARRLYGNAGGYVALAALTGRVLWRFPTHGSTYSPPIAAGGRIFAGELGGTLHSFFLSY